VTKAAQDQDLTGFNPLFPARWTINKRWQWVKLALTGGCGNLRRRTDRTNRIRQVLFSYRSSESYLEPWKACCV